jgi:mitochondrial fission protein ELM1
VARDSLIPDSIVLAEAYAGLQAQALGLAERAGLSPSVRSLAPRAPWRWFPAAHWPAPLAAVGLDAASVPGVVVGAGGVAASVGAALRRQGRRVVHVQHPRMDLARFDLVVVNRHDRVTGPNVIVTRTALHRATPERLAEAREIWAPRLAHLRRPLLSVLVGGSNGRFRLDAAVAAQLGEQIAGLMRRDGVGVALTPSRRTDPAAIDALRERIAPLGGWVWDMQGDNPYFGMLALADVVLATVDSVSMVSEAVATSAPVMIAKLPGRSRRIGEFAEMLVKDGRVRWFDGRLEMWNTAPLDDTPEAAAAVRRLVGL